jgi:hypothetical protein
VHPSGAPHHRTCRPRSGPCRRRRSSGRPSSALLRIEDSPPSNRTRRPKPRRPAGHAVSRAIGASRVRAAAPSAYGESGSWVQVWSHVADVRRRMPERAAAHASASSASPLALLGAGIPAGPILRPPANAHPPPAGNQNGAASLLLLALLTPTLRDGGHGGYQVADTATVDRARASGRREDSWNEMTFRLSAR